MTPLAAIKGGHFGQALTHRASRIALRAAKTARLANNPHYVKCRIVCFQTLSFLQGANLHLPRIPALDLAALRRRGSATSNYLTHAGATPSVCAIARQTVFAIAKENP